jgi:MoxR-like ATPase
MLKTVIDYPKMDEERMVVRQNLKGSYEKVNQVVSVEQILRAQEAVREVYMDEKIEKYILISFLPLDTQKNINWQI